MVDTLAAEDTAVDMLVAVVTEVDILAAAATVADMRSVDGVTTAVAAVPITAVTAATTVVAEPFTVAAEAITVVATARAVSTPGAATTGEVLSGRGHIGASALASRGATAIAPLQAVATSTAGGGSYRHPVTSLLRA